MNKSKVISLIMIIILLGGVIIFNNREFLFNHDNIENGEQSSSKDHKNKAVQTADGWELASGEYYFEKDLPPGIYDFTTLKGEMSIDGKRLNENCSLRNYISMSDIPLKISGDGLVLMKDISGKSLDLEWKGNKVKISESGYYLNSFIVNNETGEGKVRISCEDTSETDLPIIVELQDSNNREVSEKLEILKCDDSYELEIANGQSLYIDFSKENKDRPGYVTVETIE